MAIFERKATVLWQALPRVLLFLALALSVYGQEHVDGSNSSQMVEPAPAETVNSESIPETNAAPTPAAAPHVDDKRIPSSLHDEHLDKPFSDGLKGRRHPVISTPRPGLNDYKDSVRFARLSSPRKTWESFLMLMDEYGQEIEKNGYTYENRDDLKYLESQIVNLFDLRGVSDSLRKDAGMRAAVYMRDAAARYDLPELDILPTRSEAFQEMKDGYPGVWTVYESPIEIVYVDSGAFEGRFQFSYQTVLNAKQLWDSVSRRPYVYPEFEGLVDAYLNTPGPGIPDDLIDSLPEVFRKDIWGMRVWQFVIVAATNLIALALLFVVVVIVNKGTRSLPRVLRSLVSLVLPVMIICLGSVLNHFFSEHVFLTGRVLSVIYYAKEGTSLLCVVVIIFIIGNILAELILFATRFEYQGIDTYLIRFGLRLASIIIAVIVLIEGFQRMGFTLATVIAGAGVTGLAVALAAQESLRNVFGSVMLLLDKPFRVGQRVKVREHEGFVEEIGLRSTKLRLLNGHLVSLPNEDVARADIENIAVRPYIRRKMNLAIPLDTPAEKVKEAIEIMRDILAIRFVDHSEQEIAANPKLEDESRRINEQINKPGYPPRIFFDDFNTVSLNILVLYWYHPPTVWEFYGHAEQINNEIVKRFQAAGIPLARPSQTLYFGHESPEASKLDFSHGDEELPTSPWREIKGGDEPEPPVD